MVSRPCHLRRPLGLLGVPGIASGLELRFDSKEETCGLWGGMVGRPCHNGGTMPQRRDHGTTEGCGPLSGVTPVAERSVYFREAVLGLVRLRELPDRLGADNDFQIRPTTWAASGV
jgi:hypothetical protein